MLLLLIALIYRRITLVATVYRPSFQQLIISLTKPPFEEVALVDLLRTWNIRPTAVAGHSSGEIGAAYAMGALTKEDAWRVAYYRGILSTEAKANNPEVDGSMMAAGLSPEKAEEWFTKVTAGKVV